MSRTRKVNDPLEVYLGGDTIYQVLAKLPMAAGETHVTWLVAVSNPREVERTPQEAYGESIERNGTLVWSQGDGPLPEQYKI